MKDIRIVFMGTPSFAYVILKRLIESYNVVLVVSQPDAMKDRKGNVIYSPVKELAINSNIKVIQPNKIRKEYKEVLDAEPDIIITCAYGQLIPEYLLNYPKYGCINVHGSLLPKLRGGAPIHHALIDGYDKTGITVMYMNEKMDAGDIISTREIVIDDNEYLDSLYEKMSVMGADLLMETLPDILSNKANRIKQDESEITYGLNITADEEHLNFNDTSRNIYNRIRGLNSNPGSYAIMNNKRLKIFGCLILEDKFDDSKNGEIVRIDKDGFVVKTNDSSIKIINIQLEGKKRTIVKDYLNGIDKNSILGIILE